MPSEDVVAFKHAYCPECGAVENSDEDGCCLMCGADIIVGTKFDELMDSNERFMAALRRIAGELGEFADADGETMVEKIRFFRAEVARLEQRDEVWRAALCRAREALEDFGEHPRDCRWHDPGGECNCGLGKALNNSSPCPHEAELKAARETIAGQESEIREGDFWQERARESFSNGTCPTCFCTDEGPHEKGCVWAKHEADAKELVEWACVELVREGMGTSYLYAELRRRAGGG